MLISKKLLKIARSNLFSSEEILLPTLPCSYQHNTFLVVKHVSNASTLLETCHTV